MATTTFLGYPPAGIRSWIEGNAPTPTPSLNNWNVEVFKYSDPTTKVTEGYVNTPTQTIGDVIEWTGNFENPDDEMDQIDLSLKQTFNGIGYTWTLGERGAATQQEYVYQELANVQPDDIVPTSIDTTNETNRLFIYKMTRQLD